MSRGHPAYPRGAATAGQVEATDDGAVVLRHGGREGGLDALIDRVSGCLKGYHRDPLAELEADHRAEIE